MSTQTIYELAINQVKPGCLADFKVARAAFITEMKKTQGVGPDAAYQSFFTMPGENESEVFVGVTEWNSAEDFANAAVQLAPTAAFQNYFQTFEQLAYLQLRLADGEPFDLAHITGNGHTVEFAARTVKPGQEHLFAAKRKAFFDVIAAQPGYLFDREFVAIDSDVKAVIIAWESQADFQNALGTLSQMAEMGDFFSILDVQAYQATQQVIA